MPLAERVRVVPVLLEDFRKHSVFEWDVAVASGIARRPFGNAGHAVGVMIAPREHARARRRAKRRGVHVVVAEPISGERVQIRSVDWTPVAPKMAEAGVVQDYEQDIR